MISAMHDSHITKPPHVVITFTELDTLIEATYKSAIEECVRVAEGMRFKYEPPYEGQEDKEMERDWQQRVTALTDLITTLKADK